MAIKKITLYNKQELSLYTQSHGIYWQTSDWSWTRITRTITDITMWEAGVLTLLLFLKNLHWHQTHLVNGRRRGTNKMGNDWLWRCQHRVGQSAKSQNCFHWNKYSDICIQLKEGVSCFPTFLKHIIKSKYTVKLKVCRLSNHYIFICFNKNQKLCRKLIKMFHFKGGTTSLLKLCDCKSISWLIKSDWWRNRASNTKFGS